MTITRRSFLAGTAASAAAAGAMRPTTARAAQTITVQYAWARTYQPIMEEIARRYTALNPAVRIEFLAPTTDYEDMAQRTLRAAITGGLPDVAFQGIHRADLLAERELVVPLDPFIAAEAGFAAQGYSPALLTLASSGDRTYGMPFAVAIKSVYFNTDLVRRAGGDPERLPRTWDEIIALQRKIQALGSGVSGLYIDYYYDDNNFSFHSLIQTQGGAVATPANRIAFDGAEGLQALRWLRQMGEAGMIDMSVNQAYQSFSAGTLGILVASSSRVAQLTDGAKGRFGVTATAFPRTATGRVPGGGAAAMIHTKDRAKQAAAWDFVKFATGPIGSTEVVLRSGYIPGNAAAAEDPALLGGFYAANPNHRVMLEQIPVLTKFYNWPGENSLKIPTVIRDAMQQVVTLRATPEAVMPKLSADVRALLGA